MGKNTMKSLLAICLLFVHGLAEVCQKIDQCSCKKSSGKIISLWSIDGGSKGPPSNLKGIPTYSPTGTPWMFDWNPCTKFSEGTGCKDMLMCQRSTTSATDTHPCADSVSSFKVDSDGTTSIMYEEYTEHSASGDYKRTVTIELKCSEDKSPGDMGQGVTEDYKSMDSKYSATFTSKCACDDGCPHPESGSSGLSVGSILLIVFFVLIIVYIIAGILINKFKLGVESMPEMCPNYLFWAGIPSLIKDGVVFTCGSIKSACSSLCGKSGKDGYAKI